MRHDFSALTPVRFLSRAATVYGKKLAVIDGDFTCTYAELYERSKRLAGALFELDLRAGGRVAILAGNNHEIHEAHYGVPDVSVTADALRLHLLDRIAKLKIPDEFEFSTLPKTATGKVQKFELKKRLASRYLESPDQLHAQEIGHSNSDVGNAHKRKKAVGIWQGHVCVRP